jgi:hypothetical protein
VIFLTNGIHLLSFTLSFLSDMDDDDDEEEEEEEEETFLTNSLKFHQK